MNPQRNLLRAVLIVPGLAFSQSLPAAEEIYRREFNAKNPGGKVLVITVQGVSRDDKTSSVRLTGFPTW